MHNSLVQARGILDKTVRDLRKDMKLSDDEVAQRYVMAHRGNPRAITEFVMMNAPKGTDPMKAAYQYERRMEALLKARQNA